MQVDKARLDEMLAGLEGVTPGPWKLYEVGSRPYLCPATVDGGSLLTITREDDVEFAAIDEDADALHFLRCDPDTMRSIITELLELRSLRSTEGKEVNRLREALRNIAEGNLGDDPWQANYDKIRAVARAALTRSPE